MCALRTNTELSDIHQQFKIFYLRYFAPKKLITCVKKSICSEVNGPTFWKILGNIHFCGIPHSLSVLIFWLFLPNISNAYLTLICIHRVWRRNCCCLRRRLSCSMYFFRYVSTHTHFLPFGCLVKPCKRKIDWWKYIIKQYEYAQQQQQRAREKKNMSLHFATIFGPMQSTGLQSTFEFVCVFAFGVHSKSVRKRADICITICLLNSCIAMEKK